MINDFINSLGKYIEKNFLLAQDHELVKLLQTDPNSIKFNIDLLELPESFKKKEQFKMNIEKTIEMLSITSSEKPFNKFDTFKFP